MMVPSSAMLALGLCLAAASGAAATAAAAAAAATTAATAAAGSKVITMSILGEDEVMEYRRRRLQEGNSSSSGGSASGEEAPRGAPRRRLHGHITLSDKTIQEGQLDGNTMPLGYYYARVHVGTPGQEFTVIVDTGSSLMAVPCTGCKKCGKHMNTYFEQSTSNTYSEGCNKIEKCKSCSGGHCTYKTHYVEGSSIGGYLVKDQVGLLMVGAETPQFTAEAIFGCQQSETGLFKAQLADGIMGLGYGKYDTVFDSLVHQHKVKDTLSFCVHRSGGYIQFGADAPTAPGTISTPLVPHSKYYVLKIKGMKVGPTDLGVDSKVYNTGHGAIIDSGTSLSYYPRQVYQRMRQVFASETKGMNLGKAERIDGADCWRVSKVPGGLSSFPTYVSFRLPPPSPSLPPAHSSPSPSASSAAAPPSPHPRRYHPPRLALNVLLGRLPFPPTHRRYSVDFDEVGYTEFHPVHYMFNHPRVENPTHYCYGILDNG
jgi:hypothetical protein